MTPRRAAQKRLIEHAYEQAEAAGILQLNEDEAGPYQAIPQPGVSWQPEGHPALQPQEYERGGTAKLLTLFRPATGEIRAKGVVSVTNAVLHPWLKGELGALLAELEKQQPAETLAPEERRPPAAQWKTWLWPHESAQGLPPLRIIIRRALSGQHPQSAQQVIDWLEQTVTGWNKKPTPFVWNGKRRRRRERARLRRLGGSGAALVKGYAIAS
jgi:hypothetical protein